MYLVSQQPFHHSGAPRIKSEALDVRDGLLAATSVSSLLDVVMILSRWDVLIRPHPGVNLPFLADTLRNLDNFVITDAVKFRRVSSAFHSQRCQPPSLLLYFPLHFPIPTILHFVTSISPVTNHQDIGKPGQILLTFPHPRIALTLYGLQVATDAGAIKFTCGSGDGDAASETELGLPPRASLADRQALLSTLISESPPRLSVANLLSHGASIEHPEQEN
jgi:hypothetical protein